MPDKIYDGVQIWAGTEDSLMSFLATTQRMSELTATEKAQYKEMAYAQDHERDNEFGDMDYMVSRHENVAIINISGEMTPRASFLNRWFGMTSYEEIRSAVIEAVNHAEVDTILLNLDSPGGAVSGISEISGFLKQVDADHKPIYAYTGTMMASAAYWLGSVGRKTYATELASVGSIGVIAIHKEFTQALEKAGIKATVLRQGEYKALGNPYEKLTEKARGELESRMAATHGVFARTVSENRNLPMDYVMDKVANGKVFLGNDARELGLIDGVRILEDVVLELVDGNDRDRQFAGTQDMAKRKTISAQAQAAIASGVPVEEALAEEPVTTSPEASAEAAAEDGVAAGAEAGAEPTGTEAGEGAPVQAAEEQSKDTKKAGDSDVLASLFTRLDEANDKVADLKVQNKELQTKLDKIEATHTQLAEIAAVATQRMMVALGSPASDLQGMDASVLVAEYHRAESQFNARFKVGQQAAVATEEREGDDGKSVTTMDSSRVRAVQFNKNK